MNSLSNDAGVDVKTVQSWIGVLESSFIIHLLRPYHKNFNKTIIKRPKIYFFDTSLVCSLLGIRTKEHLIIHPSRGALFECMVVNDFIKSRYVEGLPSNLYYWRDKTGHEIDMVFDDGPLIVPTEIKSGKTINQDMFKNLLYWQKLTGTKPAWLLYGGDRTEKRSNGITATHWKNFPG